MLERFSQVFREIEHDLGTRDLNILFLRALRDAFEHYTGRTLESLVLQMEEIVHIVNNTEPRFAIIIYNTYTIFEHLQEILNEAKEDQVHKHSYIQYRDRVIQVIDELTKRSLEEKQELLSHASKIDVEGKIILMHDHSHTVQDVLANLKQQGRTFKVIVAEQDMEKTLSNIEFLTTEQIPFRVVPAHMLSNIEEDIDMCFFGALTLKNTYDFVTDTGTNAVISEFHLQKKPIYIFISISKFSLWESHKKETINKKPHNRKHPFKDITFERFKFSHDRVPLSAVDYVVTEKGVLEPAEVKELYKEKYKAQSERMTRFEKI